MTKSFNLDFKTSCSNVRKGKMMFQLDDHSTCDSLIHVCFDWMTNAQTAST